MQILGRARIYLGGRYVESKKGASLDPGGVKREAATFGVQVHYAEETVPATIECAVPHTPQTDLVELGGWKGEASFVTDTGQSYVIRGAFVTEPPKLTEGDTQIALKISGNPAVTA